MTNSEHKIPICFAFYLICRFSSASSLKFQIRETIASFHTEIRFQEIELFIFILLTKAILEISLKPSTPKLQMGWVKAPN